jgi:hypothetical protein
MIYFSFIRTRIVGTARIDHGHHLSQHSQELTRHYHVDYLIPAPGSAAQVTIGSAIADESTVAQANAIGFTAVEDETWAIKQLKGNVTMLFITHALPKNPQVDEIVQIGISRSSTAPNSRELEVLDTSA